MKNLSIKQLQFFLIFLKVCAYLVLPIISIMALTNAHLELLQHNPRFFDGEWTGLGRNLLVLIIDLPLLIYCAFKKRGTRYLTFSIWTYRLSLVITVLFTLMLIFSLAFPSNIPETLQYTFPSVTKETLLSLMKTQLIITISVYTLTLFTYLALAEYRKRNNAFLFENLITLQPYPDVFENLSQAESPSDLKLRFLQTKQEYPEIRNVLRMKYREYKRALRRK